MTGNNQINVGDANYVASLGTLSLSGLAEPTVPPPPRGSSPLLAASEPAVPRTDSIVSQRSVDRIVSAAIQVWAAAGLSLAEIQRLKSVTVTVADLGAGGYLGLSSENRILIDDNAAGWGWFVDSTPRHNEEFVKNRSSLELRAKTRSQADQRMDLLTVVMHELGHQLGLSDDHSAAHMDTLLAARLTPGTRRLPDPVSMPPGFAAPELPSSIRKPIVRR